MALENLQTVGNYSPSEVHGECYSPQPDHEGQTVMVVTQKFFASTVTRAAKDWRISM